MDSPPLTEACMNNELSKVQQIVENAPEVVLTRDDDQRVALHWAVSFQHEEVVMYLLSHMESVDLDELKDKAGWTPFHIACAVGNMSIIIALYNRRTKPDLDLTTAQGVTALHLAVSKKHIEVCKFLLVNGASVRIRDKKQQLPLHRAAALGSMGLVQLLCEAKSPVNSQDFEGWTPLFHALAEGHGDVAVLLVNKYNADENLENSQGSKAVNVALNDQIKNYFIKNIA